MLDALKRLLRALGMGAGGMNGNPPEGEGAPAGAADSGAGSGGQGGRSGGSCESSESVEMLSCSEVLERLFEYLDGELEATTASQVREHLEKCRRCYPRLEFERAFMEALNRARAGEEPPRDLRNRVVDVLREEGLELG